MMTRPTDEITDKNEGRAATAARLHDLFRGADHRHGTYLELHLVKGKMEMKDENGRGPKDEKGPPTVDLWERHLAGIKPLGVSPVRVDGMCRWGVIDVDEPGADPAEMAAEVARLGLPLVVCRSKSGRAHAFLFASDWMPQADMNAALVAMARYFRYNPVEFFPRRDSPGNWVNMPYIGGDQAIRSAFKPNGLEMTAEEFVATAEAARLSPDEICRLAKAKPRAAKSPDPGKAAPGTAASGDRERAARLLAQYAEEVAKTPEGGRANKLFGRAKDMGRQIGAGRIDENVVKNKLVHAGLTCGLDLGTATQNTENGIRDGMKEPPDDGDDGGGTRPDVERIVVITGGEEDEWRLMLGGWGEITLPVKDVMHFYTFNVRCAARLGAIFSPMKQEEWYELLRPARAAATFEETPETETQEHEMRELLRAFLTDKHKAETLDEVALGKAFHDEDEKRRYFLFGKFCEWLNGRTTSFGKMKPNVAGRWVRRAIGTENLIETKKKLKSGYEKVHYVPADIFDRTPELPLPKIEPEPI